MKNSFKELEIGFQLNTETKITETMKYLKKYDNYKKCECGCNCKCSPKKPCKCKDCKCRKSNISEDLQYHLDMNIPITENVFRFGSEGFYDLLRESRKLFDRGEIEFSGIDKELFETTDLGKFGEYKGEMVPLDLPIENIVEVNEAEYKGKKVDLNKPMRSSGPKKYKVYVKDPKTGNIKVVNFGDVKGGLSAKVSDPKARAAFAKRHRCSEKKDKTTPGYWACRLNRFGHLFSGNKTYPGFW